jgi:hypothetical protein
VERGEENVGEGVGSFFTFLRQLDFAGNIYSVGAMRPFSKVQEIK